jgi:hypothetical protein
MFKVLLYNFPQKDKNYKKKKSRPMASQPDSNKSHVNKIHDENHYTAPFRKKY